MLTIFWIALLDLRSHWRVIVVMILFFAINVFAYIELTGYQLSINAQFHFIDDDYLIIHEADTAAEYYGSRLSPIIGEELTSLGYSRVIPAVHSFTVTAGREIQFIYGIDLEQYQDVERFHLLAGRVLQVGDSQRSVMLGSLFAEKIKATIGDTISLRGRDFQVVGIFKTGTFTDNDAWISLPAAQTLLGWGEDVSYYLVPDSGVLKAGDTFGQGIVVSRRGESVYASSKQYLELLELFAFVIQCLGFGTVITMGALILRITILHQYPLALMRVYGFSKISLYIYILSQAVVIFIFGFMIGFGFALLFPLLYQLNVSGWVILPSFVFSEILRSFGYLFGFVLIGVLIPILWFNRLNLSKLLRSE